eukprot:COSAG01_NODE_3416_length_6122_cov_11.318114_10_plen_132_part_00
MSRNSRLTSAAAAAVGASPPAAARTRVMVSGWCRIPHSAVHHHWPPPRHGRGRPAGSHRPCWLAAASTLTFSEPAVADRRGIGFGWLQNAWLLHACPPENSHPGARPRVRANTENTRAGSLRPASQPGLGI